MISISSRTRLAAAASPLAVAMVLASGQPAWAQVTQAANVGVTGQATQETASASPAPSADDQGAIVVTGFRASLQSAISKKKKSDQIVESVSAEDIGKLPDASIAESIARLPGVAAQRIAGSGRTSYLSIRGFAPDYSTTLLNGREQTSTGDNRAVEYDQYPSEVVSQVNIYKTPLASVIGQGIAGTVDIRTIRPLEYGKRVISIGGRGVYIDNGKKNDGSKEFGYRLNGAYIDQFADGRVGVALAASWNDEPYSLTEFNSWGYPTIGTGESIIGGTKSYVTSTQLKRLGLVGTLEFKPTDNFTSTIDGFYSDFKDDQIKRGMEVPLFWSSAALQPGFVTSDGAVVQGTFTNVNAVPRNVSQDRKAKLYAFGWNNLYDAGNGWHALFDLSYSKVKRSERIFEVWGTTGGVTDTMNFETTSTGTSFDHLLDYSDPNLFVLSNPGQFLGGSWGGTGYSNNRIVNDRIWQYRGEISKDLDTGFISRAALGANWTNHDKSLIPDEGFLRLPGFGEFGTVSVPANLVLRPTDLDFLGLGPTIAFNPLDLLDAGVIDFVSNNSHPDVQLKAYAVHENLGTIYGQFDIAADLGSARLTGNVGVQAVHTDQSTDGFIAQNGSILPETGGAKYWDVMPSLNLSLRFPSDWVIRLGLAREVMRPRLDDMRSSLRVTINNGGNIDPNQRFVQGDAGNPELRPFRANAADVSFEKYFGIKGYVSAQLFYKYFDTFVVDKSLPGVPFDATGQPLPAPFQSTNPLATGTYIPPANIANAILFQPYNVKGGKLYGIELAGTIPVGEIFRALDGFGVTGGVSYTKSKIHPYSGAAATDLPGYSKWVANGTAYFEKWGFSIRGSVRYRSSFIGEVYGFGANRDLRRARPETVFDGQVGYEFQDNSFLHGLSIYLQGQNLTDEPFVTQGASSLQVIDYQKFGRRFMLGANFKFGGRTPPPPPPPPLPPPPPPEPAPATQTCANGSVILATDACPVPPPPPPPPPPAPERGH
jgi:iron complex outermembrane receptor protein